MIAVIVAAHVVDVGEIVKPDQQNDALFVFAHHCRQVLEETVLIAQTRHRIHMRENFMIFDDAADEIRIAVLVRNHKALVRRYGIRRYCIS